MTTTWRALIGGGVCLVLVAVLAANRTAIRRALGTPAHLRIVFTGNTAGRLSACMCDGRLAGGLDYRQAAIAAITPPYVLLDTGNVGDGRTPADRERADAILDRMRGMGYSAVNIGAAEAALGLEWITGASRRSIPLVSLNLMQGDAYAAESHRVLECGGASVLVTGILDPAYPVAAPLRIENMTVALERLLARRAGEGTAQLPMVLLADLGRDAAADVARRYPEIAVMLVCGRNDTIMPIVANRSVMAGIAGGRYMAELSMPWPERAGMEVPDPESVLMRAIELLQPEGRMAPVLPAGISVSPEVLDFGHITAGGTVQRTIEVSNRTGSEMTIARVYSPCTCFVMAFPETPIADGRSARIDVTLHSVSLEGDNRFALHVQLTGAHGGMFSIPAVLTAAPNAEGR